ncbi:phosphoethanolamine transferase [Komagataeibacter sucrofermentans]|uniref:Sulfatase N-terminal domain-containing protein n=1 Tax=Komagataeibacter sucrofermentans TaxID=1053551 RepID=A0A318QS77_9PROT|nr:phosphoethanolamine transferase [Komagataeibacter sucrofermentans]PYD80804.1 hypothetical protein CFR77_02600 [Komagataeibacter sucrofermentans]
MNLVILTKHIKNLISDKSNIYIFSFSILFYFINKHVSHHDGSYKPIHFEDKYILLICFLAAMGKVVSSITVPLIVIFSLLYYYTSLRYGLVTKSMMQAIAGTNIHQALSMMTSVNILMPFVIVVFVALLVFITWKCNRFRPLLLLVSMLSMVHPLYYAWENGTSINKERNRHNIVERAYYLKRFIPGILGELIYSVGMWCSQENRPAVPHTKIDPAVIGKNEGRRKNIIMVIGESAFASRHTYYGYKAENTTPNMQKLINDNRICVLPHTHSAANMTREAVPMLVSFFEPEHQEKLYSEKNIIELAKDNGYKTFWIASQPGRGEYSRTFGYISEFSDYVTRQDYNNAVSHVTWRDESLLPVVKEKFGEQVDKKFFVIHLMGSHESYADDRTQEDIDSLPHADPYDQSIHRTDRILQQIIDMADKKLGEYTLIYISDHGEIVNQGHGIQFGGYDQYMIPAFIIDKNNEYCKTANDMRNYENYYTSLFTKYLVLDMLGYNVDSKYIEHIKSNDVVLHSDGEVYNYKDIPQPPAH